MPVERGTEVTLFFLRIIKRLEKTSPWMTTTLNNSFERNVLFDFNQSDKKQPTLNE